MLNENREGVIKYQLIHQNTAIDQNISITSINAWRTLFVKLELIGQVAKRYQGYGFGNISQRQGSSSFLISGTQTGHIETLSKQHYCTILEASPETNQVKSLGETQPSSEALTHASVYQQNNKIMSVIHVHSPEIWHNSAKLEIPCTSAKVKYGTPEMAEAVNKLFNAEKFSNTAVFSMLGHEDGIIAFSDCMEKAAHLLIELFYKSLMIEQNR